MKQKSNIFERFRSQSNRLQGYDYSQNGAYFVTICVKDRVCVFGEVKNEEVVLNSYGEIVKNIIEHVSSNFDSVDIDSYVIMPNHLHLIVVICRDAINRISTKATKEQQGGFTKDKNPMLGQYLGTIIRWLKGKATFEIRKEISSFSWQSNYHDHIIRNEEELQRIREYIFNNPAHWENDDENIKSL